MRTTVAFYAKPDGTKPVAQYMRDLNDDERAKLTEALRRIGNYGIEEPGVTVKPIEGKLWEIKVSAQRAFYCMVEATWIVVLHAYYKKSQKAPARELEIARKRMEEVLEEE